MKQILMKMISDMKGNYTQTQMENELIYVIENIGQVLPFEDLEELGTMMVSTPFKTEKARETWAAGIMSRIQSSTVYIQQRHKLNMAQYDKYVNAEKEVSNSSA